MLFETTKRKLKIIAFVHYVALALCVIMAILNAKGVIKSPLLTIWIQPEWLYYAVWGLYALLIAAAVTVVLIKNRK